MRWIFVLFFGAGLCVAQPVSGPFQIASVNTPATLESPLFAIDTADVVHAFYVLSDSTGNSILYSRIHSPSGEVLSPATVVRSSTSNFFTLQDVRLDPTGIPALLVVETAGTIDSLMLLCPDGEIWLSTILYHVQDGFSQNHGMLPHDIQSARFVALTDSYIQVSFYHTGVWGDWFLEGFAIPCVCFIDSADFVNAFPIEEYGLIGQGILQTESLGQDSMYVWIYGYSVYSYKYVARRDGSWTEMAEYTCLYGDLAGMTLPSGDRIHLATGVTGGPNPGVVWANRVNDSTCEEIGTTFCIGFLQSASVYEGQGFVIPLNNRDRVELLRIDTLGTPPLPSGTIAWHETGRRFIWSTSAVSSNGRVVVAWVDYSDETGERRLAFSSCDWATPLTTREFQAPVPNYITLTTYPNPFNSTVRIDYDLPRASDVQVSIHNTLGQQVATLYTGRADAGSHTLNWSPDAASGVYFVKLVAGDFVTSRKILYVR